MATFVWKWATSSCTNITNPSSMGICFGQIKWDLDGFSEFVNPTWIQLDIHDKLYNTGIMGCEWLWGFKGLFWWRIPHMIASIMGISPTGVTSWDIFGCVRTHTRIHQLPIRFVQNTHIHEFHMSCLKTGWYLMVPHGTSWYLIPSSNGSSP